MKNRKNFFPDSTKRKIICVVKQNKFTNEAKLIKSMYDDGKVPHLERYSDVFDKKAAMKMLEHVFSNGLRGDTIRISLHPMVLNEVLIEAKKRYNIDPHNSGLRDLINEYTPYYAKYNQSELYTYIAKLEADEIAQNNISDAVKDMFKEGWFEYGSKKRREEIRFLRLR